MVVIIIKRNLAMHSATSAFNTLRPKQNGRPFPDDIFNCIILNENVWISNDISLKFVPKGQIYNIPALVQIMAWRRPGDKPLSDTMKLLILYVTMCCLLFHTSIIHKINDNRAATTLPVLHLFSEMKRNLTVVCHVTMYLHRALCKTSTHSQQLLTPLLMSYANVVNKGVSINKSLLKS